MGLSPYLFWGVVGLSPHLFGVGRIFLKFCFVWVVVVVLL